MWVEAATALGGLTGGSFVTHLFMRRKYKTDADATVSSEALKLVQALQGELEIIKKEVHALRDENIAMHKTIAILETEKLQLQGRIEHLETELAKHDTTSSTSN